MIVGINNRQQIMLNFFELIFLECQYAIISNGIWKGILNKAWSLDIPINSLGFSEMYKYILAGNTAINKTIMPHAATLLVLLKNNNIPRITSINPLSNTISFL